PYPPTVYYLQPVPSVVVVPEPETIIVPAPEPVVVEPQREPEVVESVTLDEVIADIEEAWERDRLSLLMRHVRQDGQIQVYRSGEWIDTLSRTQFEQKTEQAFREYDTVSMTFEKPELLGRDESGAPGARARGTHVYKTRDGGERRVHVTYAFRKYGWSWYVVGLDYEPTPRQDAAAPESAPNAAPARGYPVTSRTALAPAHYALPVAGQLRLVSAPPVRVRDLLNARQPRPLATVKWLQGSGRTFYTLQAMRGVVPGTVAWALYRKGEKRPVETGAADVGALPLNGWIAVRPQGPQLVMLASQAPARRRTALLATHTFPDASLALVPAKPAHGAKPRHKGRRFRVRKSRRV
ncbi:MAG TPA: hypothetical protein VJO72_10475, partial [Candidatus Dormibacteraeota bacterium]|nr:hypothetical protein [Candidatus Dormibacteraeota bacterium]